MTEELCPRCSTHDGHTLAYHEALAAYNAELDSHGGCGVRAPLRDAKSKAEALFVQRGQCPEGHEMQPLILKGETDGGKREPNETENREADRLPVRRKHGNQRQEAKHWGPN